MLIGSEVLGVEDKIEKLNIENTDTIDGLAYEQETYFF